MADITENLTAQMQEALEKGISLAIFSKNPQVVPLHIFWALLADSNSILNQVFNKMNVSKDAVELEVKSKISSLPNSSNVTKDNVSVSRELINSLENAKALMVSMGDSYIAVDTWIISSLELSEIKQILSKFCDILEDKLRALKRLELRDESARDSYLDELEALSKELVYIKTMHQSNLNPAVWEGKLFEFLNKTDALIEKYAADAERSLQDWRKELEMEFKNL